MAMGMAFMRMSTTEQMLLDEIVQRLGVESLAAETDEFDKAIKHLNEWEPEKIREALDGSGEEVRKIFAKLYDLVSALRKKLEAISDQVDGCEDEVSAVDDAVSDAEDAVGELLSGLALKVDEDAEALGDKVKDVDDAASALIQKVDGIKIDAEELADELEHAGFELTRRPPLIQPHRQRERPAPRLEVVRSSTAPETPPPPAPPAKPKRTRKPKVAPPAANIISESSIAIVEEKLVDEPQPKAPRFRLVRDGGVLQEYEQRSEAEAQLLRSLEVRAEELPDGEQKRSLLRACVCKDAKKAAYFARTFGLGGYSIQEG